MVSTVWRGHLTFGLVSFPVRLYRAARAEKVSFRRLYRPASAPPPALDEIEDEEPLEEAPPPPPKRKGSAASPAPEPEPLRIAPTPPPPAPPAPVFRTHNAVVAPSGDEPVSRDKLVKGFEYEKGQYVVLEEEELRSIKPATSKTMEIVEFVRMAEIDPIFLETSYYVSPDEAGERPYSLLYEAFRQTGYVGLAQVAMHSREHVAVLRPGNTGIIAHTMFYPDEVRKIQEFRTDVAGVNARELDLAKRLIETMVVPFEAEKFRDTYRERLQEMIDRKVAGRQVTREATASRPAAEVIDIMQALQESLKAAKKPAGVAEAPPAARKSRSRKAG